MKIEFLKADFEKYLSALLTCVSGVTTMPATQGIFFSAETDGKLVLKSYDTTQGVIMTVKPNHLELDGGNETFVIPAKKLYQIIQTFKDDDLILISINAEKEKYAKISVGNTLFKIAVLPGDDFPSTIDPHAVEAKKKITIKSNVLASCVQQTSFCMPDDALKAILNGMYFTRKNDGLETVTCDGVSLAKYVVDDLPTKEETPELSDIIPSKIILNLCRLIGREDPPIDIDIEVSPKHLVFVCGEDLIFFTRKISGEFINYEKILRNDSLHTRIIHCNRAELITALERACLIEMLDIKGDIKMKVILDIDDEKISLFAQNAVSCFSDDVEITNVLHTENPLKIGFNSKYLLDAVKTCTGDTIELCFASSLEGVIIRPAGANETKNETYFVLPLKL